MRPGCVVYGPTFSTSLSVSLMFGPLQLHRCFICICRMPFRTCSSPLHVCNKNVPRGMGSVGREGESGTSKCAAFPRGGQVRKSRYTPQPTLNAGAAFKPSAVVDLLNYGKCDTLCCRPVETPAKWRTGITHEAPNHQPGCHRCFVHLRWK